MTKPTVTAPSAIAAHILRSSGTAQPPRDIVLRFDGTYTAGNVYGALSILKSAGAIERTMDGYLVKNAALLKKVAGGASIHSLELEHRRVLNTPPEPTSLPPAPSSLAALIDPAHKGPEAVELKPPPVHVRSSRATKSARKPVTLHGLGQIELTEPLPPTLPPAPVITPAPDVDSLVFLVDHEFSLHIGTAADGSITAKIPRQKALELKRFLDRVAPLMEIAA